MAHIPRRLAVRLLGISKYHFDHWHELYDPCEIKPRRYKFADLIIYALINELVRSDGITLAQLRTSITQETLLSLRTALIKEPKAQLWFHLIRRKKHSYWQEQEEYEQDPLRFEHRGHLCYEIQSLREQLVARFETL